MESARGELRLAIDSVLEDLEDLSSRAAPPMTGDAPHPTLTVHDKESTRVDDLCTPGLLRVEYEVVKPDFVVKPKQRCEGFEVINFAEEADVIALSG